MIQEETDLNGSVTEQCDCCQLGPDSEEDSYDCASRRTVFTAREQAVLARIREMSGKARDLKRRIEKLSAQPGSYEKERLLAVKELEELRKVRGELEKERIAAAEERMRLLGHA